MRPTLFTLSGLATETHLDRRAVAKRLGSTPADGKIGNLDAWYLSSFLRACGADRAVRERPPGFDEGQTASELEAAAVAVAEGLERLRREPDVEVRRRLVGIIGPTIGRLDAAFSASTAPLPEAERLVVQPFIDRTVGCAISQLLTLCDWQLERG